MDIGFLFIIFTGIFIAPLVLGSYIIAEDADMKTITGWFGFAIVVFIGVAALGAAFIATHKLPM
jgi:hypothetical protein